VEQLASLLPIVAIALLFWLLIVRPASRRQKNMQALQRSIEVGDRVMLAAGIFGTVRGTDDERLQVEIADGVVVSVVRGAINQREDAAETTEIHSGAEAAERGSAATEPVDTTESAERRDEA
jgi:preprotein translocase subunit YajC